MLILTFLKKKKTKLMVFLHALCESLNIGKS